ncbi:hypothetical protein Ciccas_000850 [Cichlidogyrus casuarinus]|uniref:Uncharacterized protein n=1 Tax=Cichlidogyrus casuarinus TaxID=1844966 RepID=A0ABD2QMW2_9PLAT
MIDDRRRNVKAGSIGERTNEHHLLDTEQSGWNNWAVNTDKYDGWQKLSRTKSAKKLYSVCASSNEEASRDYWLRSPFISRGESENIVIRTHFMMSSCLQQPSVDRCQNDLSLFVYEANNSKIHFQYDALQDKHTLREKLKASKLFIDSPANDPGKWMNVHPVRTSISSAGFHLSLRAVGACVSVYRVEVFYYICPRIQDNFATFEKSLPSQTPVAGTCVPGSSMQPSSGAPHPIRYCDLDGRWRDPARNDDELRRTNCQCKPGHSAVNDLLHGECRICSAREYKEGYGPGPCKRCPENSQTQQLQERGFGMANYPVKCECLPNFFRHAKDDESFPCTTLPSAPQHLKSDENDVSRIKISWQPPVRTGGRPEPLLYKVTVHYLNTLDNRRWQPAQVYTKPALIVNQTEVTLHGITPGVLHKVTITAMNDLSQLPNMDLQVSSQDLELNLSPPLNFKARELTVQKVAASVKDKKNPRPLISGSVLLTWNSPSSERVIREYEINVLELLGKTVIHTAPTKATDLFDQPHRLQFVHFEKDTSIEIEKLPFNKTFLIRVSPPFSLQSLLQIRARSHQGWGQYTFSDPIQFSESSSNCPVASTL